MAQKLPILPAIVVLLLLTACGKPDSIGNRPSESAPPLTVTQAMQPANMGRHINVRGKVVEVCQEEGCWMVITDGSKKLRMTFKDESFTVPMNLHGEVLVQGVISDEIYEEDAAKSVAESIDYPKATIDAMSGDQRLPVMTSDGVTFLDKQP